MCLKGTRLQLRLYFTTETLPLVSLWFSFCVLETRIFPGSYSNAFEFLRNVSERALDVLGMKQKCIITHVFSTTSVHMKNLAVRHIRGDVTVY